jgi:hypothetical protein
MIIILKISSDWDKFFLKSPLEQEYLYLQMERNQISRMTG